MATQSVGRLTNPRAWQDALPQALFDGLSQWIQGQPFDLTHRRWLTDGKSGSYVAAIWLQPPHAMLRGAILKLLPKDLAIAESRAVRLAEQYGPPDFVQAHLVRTTWVDPLPGSTGIWLHLQEVARADVVTMLPLTQFVDDEDFAKYCETIVKSIATEWNPDAGDPPPVLVRPGDYLRADLESKADGLRAFATAAGLDPDAPPTALTTPGRPAPLPNPLALLACTAPDGHAIAVFRGRGHGDLHPGNILVPVDRDTVLAARYQLIDYGRFSPELAISRDPAKLLLSVAAAWLPGLAPGSAIRSSLAELVAAPHQYPSAPPTAGYLDLAERIYRAAGSWAVQRGLVDEWAMQHRLVLAAAALRSVARDDLSMADRWWHLEVAALAIQTLLGTDLTRVSHPSTPPSTSRPTAQAGAPAAAAPTGRTRYPGRAKVEFTRRLGVDWRDLADLLGIRPHEQAKFLSGDGPRGVWEWLEVRNRLGELREVLLTIGREDLVDMIDRSEQTGRDTDGDGRPTPAA